MLCQHLKQCYYPHPSRSSLVHRWPDLHKLPICFFTKQLVGHLCVKPLSSMFQGPNYRHS